MPITTVGPLGKYGIVKDAEPQELPDNAWSDGANVRFRDGAMERMKGEQKIFDTPAVTPYWLQPFYQGTSIFWIHAGTGAVYADTGAARTNITPASAPTGGVDDRWTGGVLNGVLVANNGLDNPYYWGGTGILLPLPAWPASTKAKSVRPFKNVLVALGINKAGTDYPHMVKWSDAAVPGSIPGSWDHTDKTRLAGELDLADDPSRMVDQLILGDANIIYKENAMYAMRASGGLSVFSFQKLPDSVGALARGCVAITPMGHVVLTHGDVVLHAGQGVRSIINNKLRKWLFQTIDTTNRARSFVTTNPAAKEVLVCFPALGDTACTLAAVWNWADDTWSIRTLDNVTYGATGQLASGVTNSWDTQAYAWQDAAQAWDEDALSPAQERLILCSSSPLITASDVTGTRNGAAYTSYAERVGMTLGDPNRVKTVRGLRVRLDASVGTKVQIEVGGAMDPQSAITWSAPVVYEVGVTQYSQIDTFATGRFIAVRVMSLDNQPWRMTSYDRDFILGGQY